MSYYAVSLGFWDRGGSRRVARRSDSPLFFEQIGVAWPLSIFNFAMYGLFIPTLDLVYVPAWNVSISITSRTARSRLRANLQAFCFSDHPRSSHRLLGRFQRVVLGLEI